MLVALVALVDLAGRQPLGLVEHRLPVLAERQLPVLAEHQLPVLAERQLENAVEMREAVLKFVDEMNTVRIDLAERTLDERVLIVWSVQHHSVMKHLVGLVYILVAVHLVDHAADQRSDPADRLLH